MLQMLDIFLYNKILSTAHMIYSNLNPWTCLELCVVSEARQREEQTQLAVVVFRGAELLQGVETLDRLLHGELQLKK